MAKVISHMTITLFLLSAIQVNLMGQISQADYLTLKLEDSVMSIENLIILDISGSDYEAIQAVTGEKIRIRSKLLIVNGDTLVPEELSTRGQSTLQFKRKSLSFKLNSKAEFKHGDSMRSLKKFSLLNLAMDKYYIHNRVAFELMEEIGIFDLFYTFCELKINGRSAGIFMVIERPEDWALITKDSPLVIRRGYDHRIDKIKADKKADLVNTKKYLNNYKHIYKSLNEFGGENLYKTLSELMDMDYYMRWLAFNFLIRNGDYCDEVFFYIDPEIDKYRIIPWDYDDIFAVAPHEGAAVSKKAIGNKLLFSSEDQLDKKIASDPYLYNLYLERMKKVLEMLSTTNITMVFENCYAELYPYYSDKEIIANVQFDMYKDANLENLRNELITLCLELNARRSGFLRLLEDTMPLN